MLKCRWCSETYTNTDLSLIDHNAGGFWCDTCDGFTFFDPREYDRRRLLLLLEDKRSKNDPHPITPLPRLRKQLSPLRYPGGKSKLIDYLYSRLHKEQLNTFVEVFAGGASLGLSLLDAGVIGRLILNEKDPGVYALWETILNHPQELVRRLRGTLPTVDDLSAAKRQAATSHATPPELAWSFLLSNRLSYSGIVMAGPQGGKNGTQEALLARWNPKALEDRILHIHSMRDKIELHNEDALTFIETDIWWCQDGTTLFIDPPYYEKGPALYPYAFTKQDHEALADLLQGLYSSFPRADVILTYDNHPVIRSLYPMARQEIIGRNYSI